VAPVSARPTGLDAMDVVAYRPGGSWVEADLRNDAPGEAARRLLAKHPPPVLADQPDDGSIRAVGFIESPSEPITRLIYTCPAPMTAALVDTEFRSASQTGDWFNLTQPFNDDSNVQAALEAYEHEEPIGYALLDYWREILEETTGVCDLLPRYFTTRQAQAIYEAVWMGEQNPANFHKWFHGNDAICEPISSDRVRRELKTHLTAVLDTEPMDREVRALALNTLGSSELVGTSPHVSESTERGLLTKAAALAGGRIAYQTQRSRGKQPQWYTRTSPDRRLIKNLYAPRPRWRVDGMPADA
jgi:hypothetical protein